MTRHKARIIQTGTIVTDNYLSEYSNRGHPGSYRTSFDDYNIDSLLVGVPIELRQRFVRAAEHSSESRRSYFAPQDGRVFAPALVTGRTKRGGFYKGELIVLPGSHGPDILVPQLVVPEMEVKGISGNPKNPEYTVFVIGPYDDGQEFRASGKIEGADIEGTRFMGRVTKPSTDGRPPEVSVETNSLQRPHAFSLGNDERLSALPDPGRLYWCYKNFAVSS